MLYNNSLWRDDIEKVMELLPELDKLACKSILITGASGLICSAIVDILFRYNDTHERKIQILAAGRSVQKMYRRFGNMVDRSDFSFVTFDALDTDFSMDIYADYIIHGAGNAFPDKIIKEPVETMLSNILGVKSLLEYAKRYGTRRLLYISSSEVYGKAEKAVPYKEDQYGWIDLLKSRNSYSIGKRAAETMCSAYADEYGVESVIVRPGHIYGPTASPEDNRVSSAWAYSAAKKEDIIMKSDGAQVRSYCYCLDCASAILKVLLYGENGRAYNISNPESIISIRQIAELLAKTANVQLKLEIPTETEQKGFNPMYNSSLDSTSLLKLGWKGYFTAEEGVEHTVTILKECILNVGDGFIDI